MERAEATRKIQELVERYDGIVREGKIEAFSEADVGSKFILPFLEALGWNTKNIDEVREQKRTLVGPVDYSLNVNRKPKIVVEIKKFGESLDDKRTIRGREESYPEQAIGYAWHLKVDWVILSNFAESRLYYSHVIRPERGLIFRLRHDKYLRDLERIWVISKDSVVSGILDTYERRRERRDIDQEVLGDLFNCRKTLVESINENNPGLSKNEIREIVQKILDRILVIRVAEDRGIIGSESLWKELDAWKTRGLPTPFMRSLKSLFRDFDEVYNSKLFEEHKCENVRPDNQVLEEVVVALYKYNFDLISADVLGAIYEDYIGHILTEEEKGIDIVRDYDKRKRSGIYYTPTHVVEYIMRHAIGDVLKDKSPDEVSNIRILDPACGSGSFLIKAFDILKEYYEEFNRKERNKEGAVGLIRFTNLITNVEKKIIDDNIFGVDLDPQAAEIASVNVMLKALRKGERLPLILGDNIKCGNSLISTNEELQKYFGEEWKEKQPFYWSKEFPEAFRDGGFNVIVGNPPHGAKLTKEERAYFSDNYEVGRGYKNSASLFIEQSSKLLRSGGLLGLVIPKSLTFSQRWGKTRNFILNSLEILEIADISKAFPEVLLEQIILLCRKRPKGTKTYRGTKLYWEEEPETYEIPIKLCRDLDNFPIHVDSNSLHIYEKVRSKSRLFAEISHTFRGLPLQSKVSSKRTNSSEPLLRGDDIKPYHHRTPQTFVDKSEVKGDSEKIAEMRKPKIISQRIIAHVLKPTDHIIIMSTFDKKGLLSVDTVENTVITDTNYDLRYLVAFLNSKLVAWYAYTFIFNKAVRTMDFDDYYVGKIPIYPGNSEEQKTLIEAVEKLLQLTSRLVETRADLEDFVNKFPRLEDTAFQDYYNRIPLEDRKVNIPSNREGRIRNIQVERDNDWLTFLINGTMIINGREQEISNSEILRIRLEDESLLNFIMRCTQSAKTSSSKGNILNRILRTKMPHFHRNHQKNVETIREIMKALIPATQQRIELAKKVSKLENQINKMIYEFYELDEKEIDVIESTLPSGPVIVDLLAR